MKKTAIMVLLFSLFAICFSPYSIVTQAAQIQPQWAFMCYGECTIEELGTGFVEFSGQTEAFSTCDSVGVTVYLQQFKNGAWQTIKSVTFTNENSDSVYGWSQYFVETGYNYRVVADHIVQQGSYVETTQSYTNPMYLN